MSLSLKQPRPQVNICRLGRISYREGWALQRQVAGLRKRGLIDDTLLLLEHDPVITYGRNVGAGSLLIDHDELSIQGIELVETDRGGDATYHGPGQLVAYPIIDLKVDMRDIRRYVWTLEEWMISVMAEYGVVGERLEGAPGAWVMADSPGELDRKMGAVGVRLSRWVTHHGIGFNVNTDLSHFKLIIPCGLIDKGVTSLRAERTQLDPQLDPQLDSPHSPHKSVIEPVTQDPLVDFHTVQDQFINQFSRLFQREPIERSLQDLQQMIANATQNEQESS